MNLSTLFEAKRKNNRKVEDGREDLAKWEFAAIMISFSICSVISIIVVVLDGL
jgi:hypothetical protein